MRIFFIKRRSLVITSVVSFSLTLGIGLAQAYPTKPIRLIAPFPAGDATGSLARALSQKLSEKLGQTLVVENLPKAGGTVRADTASKSLTDGCRPLLATGSTQSIELAISPKIPYSAETDPTPIGSETSLPNVVVEPNTLSVKSMHKLIDYARENLGELGYAPNDNGTVVRLTTEHFKAQSDTFILRTPYRGTALAIPDLVSDKVGLLLTRLSPSCRALKAASCAPWPSPASNEARSRPEYPQCQRYCRGLNLLPGLAFPAL